MTFNSTADMRLRFLPRPNEPIRSRVNLWLQTQSESAWKSYFLLTILKHYAEPLLDDLSGFKSVGSL